LSNFLIPARSNAWHPLVHSCITMRSALERL
jgi:hypothetical protein